MHYVKTPHLRNILHASPSIKNLCFVTLSAIVNTLLGSKSHFFLCLRIWFVYGIKKYKLKPNSYQATFIVSNGLSGLSLFQGKECIWLNFPLSCHRGRGQLNTSKMMMVVSILSSRLPSEKPPFPVLTTFTTQSTRIPRAQHLLGKHWELRKQESCESSES